MNSIIEVSKFEPEPAFEKTINEIKANNLKNITAIDMNLSAITLNKPYLSYEHLKSDLMPWIILQLPVKSPQSTNHLSSMYPRGNTQLKILKWWVPLRSSLYLSFFQSELSQYLSIIIPRFPTEKRSKRQFTSSKQHCFIHQQYQYQMSN